MNNKSLFKFFSSKPIEPNLSQLNLGTLNVVPEEMIKEILSYLSIIDFTRFARVSSGFYHKISNENLQMMVNSTELKITLKEMNESIKKSKELLERYHHELVVCQRKLKFLNQFRNPIKDPSTIYFTLIVFYMAHAAIAACVAFNISNESRFLISSYDSNSKWLMLRIVAPALFFILVGCALPAIGLGLFLEITSGLQRSRMSKAEEESAFDARVRWQEDQIEKDIYFYSDCQIVSLRNKLK